MTSSQSTRKQTTSELDRLFLAFTTVIYYVLKLFFITTIITILSGVAIGIMIIYQTVGKPAFISGLLTMAAVLALFTGLVYLYLWAEEKLDSHF